MSRCQDLAVGPRVAVRLDQAGVLRAGGDVQLPRVLPALRRRGVRGQQLAALLPPRPHRRHHRGAGQRHLGLPVRSTLFVVFR